MFGQQLFLATYELVASCPVEWFEFMSAEDLSITVPLSALPQQPASPAWAHARLRNWTRLELIADRSPPTFSLHSRRDVGREVGREARGSVPSSTPHALRHMNAGSNNKQALWRYLLTRISIEILTSAFPDLATAVARSVFPGSCEQAWFPTRYNLPSDFVRSLDPVQDDLVQDDLVQDNLMVYIPLPPWLCGTQSAEPAGYFIFNLEFLYDYLNRLDTHFVDARDILLPSVPVRADPDGRKGRGRKGRGRGPVGLEKLTRVLNARGADSARDAGPARLSDDRTDRLLCICMSFHNAQKRVLDRTRTFSLDAAKIISRQAANNSPFTVRSLSTKLRISHPTEDQAEEQDKADDQDTDEDDQMRSMLHTPNSPGQSSESFCTDSS
ncbi:hypothetical protein GNI_057110, partial [Gregarina niphandrodes]